MFLRKLFSCKNQFKIFNKGSHYLSTITYTDIVGVQITEQERQFIILNNRIVPLYEETSILELKDSLIQRYPDINSLDVFNNKLIQYSLTTPVNFLNQNFYVRINDNEWYYVIQNNNIFANYDSNNNLKDRFLNELGSTMGCTYLQKEIQQNFAIKFIETLQNLNSKSYIEQSSIRQIAKSLIQEKALYQKSKLLSINHQIKFLQKKLSLKQQQKSAIEKNLRIKSHKKLNKIFALLFSQFILIQYGTYAAFSWDIMEPITCLLGIGDVIIAYSFWMYTNRQFSFEEISNNYVQKRKSRIFMKTDIEEDEIDQIQGLISNLEYEKSFYSNSWEDISQNYENIETTNIF